jgi:glycerophosphoryl diester phosphodiesterase
LEAILAGSWFPSTNPEHTKAFSQARIPSLAQVLERYAGRAHLHVELKSEEQHLAATVAPLFARYGWDGREPDTVPGFTITSFHIEQLHRSRSLLPDVAHGWLLGAITEPDIDLACLLGLRAICPRAPTLSVESVHAATTRGLSVRAWGVRDEADLLLAYNSGAAGATVNWPERAQLALDAAGTPTIRSS